MGWYGDFQIQYKGKNFKKFHKLSKMIIPNSIIRFDFDDCKLGQDKAVLSCTRNLSWYNANEDMKKLMTYLDNGDIILMNINGEGDCEEIEISKQNGQVSFSNSNDKSERYTSKELGIQEMLYESLSPRYETNSEEFDITSLEGYIQFIANTFAGDEELLPIVQQFMFEVLDKDILNSFALFEEDKLSQESCYKLDKYRKQFTTLDSTRQFLNKQKNDDLQFHSGVKQSIDNLPYWLKQYPKIVISSLGGASLLKKLIDTRGETEVRKWFETYANIIISEMSKENDSDYDNSDFRGKVK